MNESTAIEIVGGLSKDEKLNIFMDYFIIHSALKYDFDVVDKTPIRKIDYDYKKGWGEPYKEIHNIAFFFIGKGIKIKTLEEFCSIENIISHDAGEDWKERGFALQKWITFVPWSIYNFIQKNIDIYGRDNS